MSLSPISPMRVLPSEQQSATLERHVSDHGETLRDIANARGIDIGALSEANPHVLNTEEPMYPGTVLGIPDVNSFSSEGGAMLPDGGDTAPSSKADVKGTGSIDGSGASAGATSSRSTTSTTSQADGSSSSTTSSANAGASVGTDGNTTANGGVSHSQTNTAADGSSTTTGSSANGSVTTGNGTTTVSGSGETSGSATTKGGSGISIKVGVNATASSGTTIENGTTTYTVSGDVSITTGGGATVKAGPGTVGGSASQTVGSKTSYTVSVPQGAAQSANPASVNPYDPASMPPGTKVTMNGADYASTEVAGTFGTSAAQISFGSKSYSANGISTQVEKVDDHTVRVTVGPTDVVSHANSMGLSVLGTGATLGSSVTVNGANLKTAAFDLSTAQGKAAYDQYLATGQLPDANGTGVSDVARVSVLDAEAARTLSVSLFGYDMTAELANSTVHMVQTTYPDGASDVVTVTDNSGAYSPQLTTTQKVDANGTLVPDSTTFTYALTVSNPGEAASYETAFGLPHGTVTVGQQLEIRMSESQMEAMQHNVATKIAFDRDLAQHGYGGGLYGHNAQLAMHSDASKDPYAFAVKLASDQTSSAMLEAAKHPRDIGMDVLPGTVSVNGAIVKEDADPISGTAMQMR